MKISKTSLLQGVALAALGCSMVQSGLAGEVTAPPGEKGTLVAQATPDAPASETQVAQATTTQAATPTVVAEPEAVIVTAWARNLLTGHPISWARDRRRRKNGTCRPGDLSDSHPSLRRDLQIRQTALIDIAVSCRATPTSLHATRRRRHRWCLSRPPAVNAAC
jgi:hypothetical protein